MTMDKIGPKEAADAIRDEFENEHVDPRFIHQVRFSGDVLAELGAEKSVENTAKVMRLLGKHNIEGHSYSDFPKWVQNERGERAVVNDEDHEKAFMARPPRHDDDGKPNPEHGHVDVQTGEFHAGTKPTVYDHTEFDAAEPVAEYDPVSAETKQRRVDAAQNSELFDAQERAKLQGQQASALPTFKPDPKMSRAEQIKAEQAKLAELQKEPN